ncbi:MAG: GNAT family N-acetyltransferase [Pseudomonadota bacterium]
MTTTGYWADDYVKKTRPLIEAMSRIRSGQRVFIGSYCGEPQHLVKGLADRAPQVSDIEIIRLMSLETTPLMQLADRTGDQNISIRSIYLGSAKSAPLAGNMRFYTPVNMAEVPRLFARRRIPIDVALIQVSPPDDFGWMSFGVSVDVNQAAALAADLVIAQINANMPMVLGQSFIHVNDVDVFVEHDEALLTISPAPKSEQALMIGQNIARLVDDGATLQIGLDAASQATSLALAEKNDLGIHSMFFTDDIMHLYARGVVTNRRKGFNNGKLVASCAVGTKALYEFLHLNPAVEFHPSDYVNDVEIIARHHKMVSMNVARRIDLAGQVSSDAVASTLFAGVSGIPDFVRGSNRSAGGRSIIMLTATADEGRTSCIVPLLTNTIVTIPREDVRWVVTEFGAVNLFGKSTQERAMAMISIAHPDFRDELLEQAKELGMIGRGRRLGDTVRGIYPVRLEETLVMNGQTVTVRPTKPVDERRIQEHFYQLDKKDVLSRFFHEKTRFARGDVESMSQIDYVRNLTIIAVVGEFGFDRVVGIGEYYLEPTKNMAEVAFSVSRDFQGKGMGRILMRKLAKAARENGILGLYAITSPGNKGMISLFKTLPYKVQSVLEDELLLSCRFDDPA